MPKGMGADPLGDAGSSCQAPNNPCRAVPVEAVAQAVQEDEPLTSLTDGQVYGPGRARSQRDGHHLASLAGDGEGPVSPLEAKAFNVGADGLRHPQPVEDKQRDQGMVAGARQSGCHQQGTHLVAVEASGMGLVVEAGTTHVYARRVCNQALLLGVAIAAGHGAQAPGDGGPSPAEALKVAGEALDV